MPYSNNNEVRFYREIEENGPGHDFCRCHLFYWENRPARPVFERSPQGLWPRGLSLS